MHFSHTPNRLRSGRPNRDASFHQGVQAFAGAGWLAAFYPITSQIIRAGVNDRCLHRQAQHIHRQFIPDMGCGRINKRIGQVLPTLWPHAAEVTVPTTSPSAQTEAPG